MRLVQELIRGRCRFARRTLAAECSPGPPGVVRRLSRCRTCVVCVGGGGKMAEGKRVLGWSTELFSLHGVDHVFLPELPA